MKTKTNTQKKTEKSKNKNREQVRIAVESVRGGHHHHHRQPWAQCPLVSDAIVTIAAHRCLSMAAWLNSCRVVPHHCSMSSDHPR